MDRLVGALTGSDQQVAHAYASYLTDGVEHDLRRYVYFLENGHYPVAEMQLPPV